MTTGEQAPAEPLLEHLFRHESGRITASLTRLFGSAHLELAEDVVQDTLLKAMREWPFKGIPDNPPAWLHRVARNLAIDRLRRDARGMALLKENAALLRSEWTLASTVDEALSDTSITDDQLRMFFACCHPSIPLEQQVALALRTLCGFSVPEIAQAFVTNEETINKRLYRAREAFRKLGRIDLPADDALAERLDHVLAVIYLLFNEGYNSTSHNELIREDLIEEALRLADLITRNPLTDRGVARALLALMLFQAARSDARTDVDGAIILLEDQDRTKWDHALIALAGVHLDKALIGEQVTPYHVEAAIAGLHANACDYASTEWTAIVRLYDVLWSMKPTPIVALNRAIAIAGAEGPEIGLEARSAIRGLEERHLFHAAQGELLRRVGRSAEARAALERALVLTRSPAEVALLRKKLARMS